MQHQDELKTFTISIFTENSPGVLQRVTSGFTRRKVNLESLTVSDTEKHGISRITLVVRVTEELAEKIVLQLRKIIEVRHAYFTEDENLYFKELSFIKVATKDISDRREVEELVRNHGGSILAVQPDHIVVEKTGSEDEIRSLYLLLEPFGISEFIHSGRIAIRK